MTMDVAGTLSLSVHLECESMCITLLQPRSRRCITESALSGELLSRLTAYPKLRAVFETLPPKLIRISSDAPAEGVSSAVDALDTRVDDVVARIMSSSFTSGSDR